MSDYLQKFGKKYKSLVDDYLISDQELILKQAYELGRQAIVDGMGVLDIAAIHHKILAGLLLNKNVSENNNLIKRTENLFLECLSPFEMTLSGFQEANTTLQQFNETLKQRTIELEYANKELDAFSYSVSHDLRAPLRHISGFVQLLEKSAPSTLNDTSLRYLKIISDSTTLMGNLIDDLLTFSRTGRSDMKKEEVNLLHLVNDVRMEIQRDLKDRNIQWKIGKLPIVYGDKSMLRLVFINLIANAVKFTRICERSEIDIDYNNRADEFIFYVKDNGVGFEMEYADKLFGVFQRLHKQEEFEGTGIGLANVRRIIDRHGGRTWAEGKVNKGATFYFSLPKNKVF